MFWWEIGAAIYWNMQTQVEMQYVRQKKSLYKTSLKVNINIVNKSQKSVFGMTTSCVQHSLQVLLWFL